MTIGTVNETLGTEFESGSFETIGGLVLDRLGRAPDVGDRITADGYVLTVDEVDGTRIATVRIRQDATDDDQPT